MARGLRVVAGDLRGRRIGTPAGWDTRPTADRVREAAFGIVGPVEGLHALDLFAGSGALAIEALSRGAERATLVERDPRAVAVIRENLRDLGLEDRATVLRLDWRSALAREARAANLYGLCLLDPPYSFLPRIGAELSRLLPPVLAPGAVVVVEHAARIPPPELAELPIAMRTDRTYGDSGIAVLRLEPS